MFSSTLHLAIYSFSHPISTYMYTCILQNAGIEVNNKHYEGQGQSELKTV